MLCQIAHCQALMFALDKGMAVCENAHYDETCHDSELIKTWLCIWFIKTLPTGYLKDQMYYFRPHRNKILLQIMALQERNLNP